MRCIAFGQAAAILLAALSAPGGAAPAPAAGPQVWQVDWEQEHCTIATGDPASLYLALWMTPGDPEPLLYLVGPDKRLRGAGERVKVTLLPGGKPIRAWTKIRPRPGQAGATVVRLSDLDEAFPRAFAKASEVRVRGFNAPIAVPIKGADEAMAALKTCLDEKMAAWGIDATAYDALRAVPKDPRDWIDAYDYPPGDQATGREGDVVARVRVDATGRVTDCAVVATSGSPAMGAVTCKKALEKGRFIPAVGADGRPTAAVRTVRANFVLEPIMPTSMIH